MSLQDAPIPWAGTGCSCCHPSRDGDSQFSCSSSCRKDRIPSALLFPTFFLACAPIFFLATFCSHPTSPSRFFLPHFPANSQPFKPCSSPSSGNSLWSWEKLGSFGFLSGAGSRAAAPPFPGKGCGRISAFSVSFPRGKTLDLGIQDLLEPGIPVPSLCQQSSEMGKVELKIQV